MDVERERLRELGSGVAPEVALEIVARFVDDNIDYGQLIEALNARLVAEGRDPVR